MRVAVYENGKHIGWVQTLSVYKGTFKITQDKSKAKHGYRTYDAIQGDIDLCCRLCNNKYGFMIDETP